MTPQLNLDAIDVDGAIRESAAEAEEALQGDTRLSFLRKAGIGTGALVSGGAVLGALAPGALAAPGVKHYSRPPAKFGKGDIGILNFALTLEYLESAFYNGAEAAHLSLDSQQTAFLRVVATDERAHVAFLRSALGRKAAKKPKFNFHGTNTNAAKFLQTAQVLENTGVKAYSGQALNIKNGAYVQAALSILTIEARHASVIGLLNQSGSGISPAGPFDTAVGAAKILADVSATGFIVG
jgi:hypothetical protein